MSKDRSRVNRAWRADSDGSGVFLEKAYKAPLGVNMKPSEEAAVKVMKCPERTEKQGSRGGYFN
jgi:hypothetical protein